MAAVQTMAQKRRVRGGVRVRTGIAKLENLLAMKLVCLYNSRKSVVAVYAGRLVHR